MDDGHARAMQTAKCWEQSGLRLHTRECLNPGTACHQLPGPRTFAYTLSVLLSLL